MSLYLESTAESPNSQELAGFAGGFEVGIGAGD